MRRVAGTLMLLSLAQQVSPPPAAFSYAASSSAAAPPSAGASSAAPRGAIQYLSPVPGARYILPESNVVLRPGGAINPASLTGGVFGVTGSRSGAHSGRIALSDDGRTITFTPAHPFDPGETVTCRLEAGLRDSRGEVPPFEFTFTIAGVERMEVAAIDLELGLEPGGADPGAVGPGGTDPGAADLGRTSIAPALPAAGDIAVAGGIAAAGALPAAGDIAAAASDSLPADFPFLTRTVSGSPSPGRLFVCSFKLGDPAYRSHLIIANDDGTPFFYRRMPARALDFKQQPDGRLTYFDTSAGAYYALDANYALVDSFRCGNGYSTDLHELRVLPNGHALLLSYDPQKVDMSAIVPGGDPNATVIGAIVQELDREKNVVFQWRSWDHFQITDATHLNLAGPIIDYAHANAVELDRDGNLLLSSRHMDEITKISRETGEILWRLGGKNNQFDFVNDPVGFSYQHDIRRLENGNVTLFDNGFFHAPPSSRALEYRLDEEAKVATLVWQYAPQPPITAFAMGSVQRLPSGHTLIGWGSASTTLTEVTPDGRKVTELSFPQGVVSYRAFRHEWPPVREAAVELIPRAVGHRSEGRWMTAVIEPIGVEPSQMVLPSVRLAGSVPPDPRFAILEPAGPRGGRAVRVRFDRAAVMALLEMGMNRLELSGNLTTGEVLRGFADLRLVGPDGPRGRLRLASALGAVPVVMALSGSAEPAEGEEVAIRVYDVRGRLVSRPRTDQEGRVRWDGRDSNGSPVASGLYFVRATGKGLEAALKVMVAR
jgi:hypothetical protein